MLFLEPEHPCCPVILNPSPELRGSEKLPTSIQDSVKRGRGDQHYFPCAKSHIYIVLQELSEEEGGLHESFFF